MHRSDIFWVGNLGERWQGHGPNGLGFLRSDSNCSSARLLELDVGGNRASWQLHGNCIVEGVGDWFLLEIQKTVTHRQTYVELDDKAGLLGKQGPFSKDRGLRSEAQGPPHSKGDPRPTSLPLPPLSYLACLVGVVLSFQIHVTFQSAFRHSVTNGCSPIHAVIQHYARCCKPIQITSNYFVFGWSLFVTQSKCSATVGVQIFHPQTKPAPVHRNSTCAVVALRRVCSAPSLITATWHHGLLVKEMSGDSTQYVSVCLCKQTYV